MLLLNVPVGLLEDTETLPNDCAIVSIGEEFGETPQLDHHRAAGVPVLSVCFSDVTAVEKMGDGFLHPIEPRQAETIVGFADKMAAKGIKILLVHCAAGVSRSAGVVLALHAARGWKLGRNYWLLSEPNPLVAGMVLRAAAAGAGEGEINGFDILG